MSLFSRLFGRKKDASQDNTQSEIEEFMSLLGIYNQAAIVAHLGITNLKMVPEFAMFKRTMRIPTVAGKLGVGEKSYIRKMMLADYKIPESFFKEMDSSIRRNCKNMRDVQSYFFAFGNFTNDLLTFLYTQSQWKLQGSMMFKSLLRSTVKSLINELSTKTVWKNSEASFAARKLRSTIESMGYSNEWMIEFVYQVLQNSKKSKNK